MNDGDAPAELLVPGRPPAFDLVVETWDGRVVWRRLEGEAIAMALGIVRLEPGEARTFVATWDGRDRSGEPVPPGLYVVRGRLPVEGGDLEAAPSRLRIRAG